MMKYIYIICLLVLVSGCSSVEYDEEIIEAHNGFKSAQQVIDEFQVGWSLGNTLDSFDKTKYDLARSDYQIQAVYSNKTWDGWDVSKTTVIESDGLVELEWTIESLNSSMEGDIGSFSLQVINHAVGSSGGEYLYMNIDSATFTLESGEVAELKDLEKIHKLSIEDDVSEYVAAELDMIRYLNTVEDLIGGTLTIKGGIERYPDIVGADEYNVTRYETYWGNPKTTQEMIGSVAAAGFQGVRVPVTYYDHLNEQQRIDEAWLDRVQELVDMVIRENMYCIINLHHDSAEGSLLTADLNTITEQKKTLIRLWSQIAVRFIDYGDSLIFEGFNEILNADGDWSSQRSSDFEAVNILNQTFVDTIRKTGGNNMYRNLIVKTYGAGNKDYIFDKYVLPEDMVEGHMITGIHFYVEDPYKSYEVGELLVELEERFTSKNLPIMITEFATFNDWIKEEGIAFTENLFAKLKTAGIPIIWWDRGGDKYIERRDTVTLFNRNELRWVDEELLDVILP